MGLFKKYKTIDEILKISDSDELISELYKYLDKKAKWGDSLEDLSSNELDIYLLLSFVNEMIEGGFEQLFGNIYGKYIYSIKESFMHIGYENVCNIIDESICLFTTDEVLLNDSDRYYYLEILLNSNSSIFEDLNDKFNNLNIDLKESILKLIKEIK